MNIVSHVFDDAAFELTYVVYVGHFCRHFTLVTRVWFSYLFVFTRHKLLLNTVAPRNAVHNPP